jgi:hypothetical protein
LIDGDVFLRRPATVKQPPDRYSYHNLGEIVAPPLPRPAPLLWTLRPYKVDGSDGGKERKKEAMGLNIPYLKVPGSQITSPKARSLEGAALYGIRPLDGFHEREFATRHLVNLHETSATRSRAHNHEFRAARDPFDVE